LVSVKGGGGDLTEIVWNNEAAPKQDALVVEHYAGGVQSRLVTENVFRDTAQWYHILIAYDTTQATASNRVKVYINGASVGFQAGSYPNQNVETYMNSTEVHKIGTGTHYNVKYDGYLAESILVDGQALTPSSFGEADETYGHWKPIEYTGTYGTNGFYLDFADSADLGNDVSGEGNDWTTNNLAATDVVLDSPTNNFATLNPLTVSTHRLALSEGNLKHDDNGAVGGYLSVASFAFSSGKWYWEVLGQYYPSSGLDTHVGVIPVDGLDWSKAEYTYDNDGRKYSNSHSTYGYAWGQGDIIGVAVDLTSSPSTITFYKNGVSQGQAFSGISGEFYPIIYTNSNNQDLVANFGQDSSFAGNKTAQGNTDGNGYGDFYYSPPTGYLALCTQNLDDPADGLYADGQYANFNTVLYTGNDSTQSITGVGYEPDWVWLKRRSAALSHILYDQVRGVQKALFSDLAEDEAVRTGLTSFDSDGFTLGSAGENAAGPTYVAWCWKANGSGVLNENGTIDSQVSANQDAGFSIVSWEGNGTAGATVGHGLDDVPELIISKNRDWTGASWSVGHADVSIGADKKIYLDLSDALTGTGQERYNSVTSDVINIVSHREINGSEEDIIAYCFHSVEGYSKVGSYTGNGSTDGPFIFLDHTPRWVLIKRTDGGGNWVIYDTVRGTYNVVDNVLFPDLSNAEQVNAINNTDFVSNGFKIRATESRINGSGANYVFYSIAENPFKYTNAR